MFAPVADVVSLVAENGAVVVRDGEMVYSQFIPKADYVRLINYTYSKQLGEPILCALDTAYIAKSAEKYREYFDQFFAKIKVVDDLTQVDAQVAKYTVYFPGGETYDIFEPDYATPFKDEFHVTIGGDYFLDMMHSGVDKGHALTELGKLIDVTPEEMVTFGDNLNDTEMLTIAGYSFVMQAGQAELDKVATERIGSNSDYAVQTKINEILDKGGQL
jgi:HAD superfamily hydrolase (TIGR01484 family)